MNYAATHAVMKVRAKQVMSRRRRRVSLPVFLMVAALFLSVGVVGFDAYSARLGIIPHHFETVEATNGKVIKVPSGGNLQAAIAQAKSGDIVELEAGGTYAGEIVLPVKPLTDYITIQSSAVQNLPANKRVGPNDRRFMATIVSGMLGRGSVSASNGAHHYRFVGVEFTTTSSMYNYGLVLFGNGETRPEKIPHHLEIDRSYIRSGSNGKTRRGIALNSADTVVSNSYIEGFAYPGEETQGICGWTGTRNVRIHNNYIEGGAENIMFGGSDPANADLIPSDIEVTENHLNKPAAWNGKVTHKTIFELKNAKRVTFTDNLLTNNWEGSAFRITVRNQDGGAPFSTIEDVTIRGNTIKGSGDGINILGRDDTHPSQTLRGLTIDNNLFLNISGGNGFDGSGYFVQVAEGERILIANNTVLNMGNIATFYGGMPRDFVFRDNIVGHGSYGVHGPVDLASHAARTMFSGNIFLNLNNIAPGDYAFPTGNKMVGSIATVGFTDLAAGDYRLSSRSEFRGKGANLALR